MNVTIQNGFLAGVNKLSSPGFLSFTRLQLFFLGKEMVTETWYSMYVMPFLQSNLSISTPDGAGLDWNPLWQESKSQVPEILHPAKFKQPLL